MVMEKLINTLKALSCSSRQHAKLRSICHTYCTSPVDGMVHQNIDGMRSAAAELAISNGHYVNWEDAREIDACYHYHTCLQEQARNIP